MPADATPKNVRRVGTFTADLEACVPLLPPYKKALKGDNRPEHLFVLQQAFSLYGNYEERINACDEQIVRETALLPNKVDPPIRPLPRSKEGRPASKDQMHAQDTREVLYRKFGADLTAIEGIGVTSALVIWTEVGSNVVGFKTENHFCSWLGLCPDNRISGGKVLSSHTRRVINRASDALRVESPWNGANPH